MIHELYKKAGGLHGHYCPGLAIGVRAAALALERLSVTENERGLYCIAESRACYIDGIQSVFGTTIGNGGLELRDRGKAAFNFYDRQRGRALRLVLLETPGGMSREELIEYILTAPAEQVFSETEPHFEPPEDVFKRQRSQKCALCGEECREPSLRLRDGAVICLDCYEK